MYAMRPVKAGRIFVLLGRKKKTGEDSECLDRTGWNTSWVIQFRAVQSPT
jgi:hypothetical protein